MLVPINIGNRKKGGRGSVENSFEENPSLRDMQENQIRAKLIKEGSQLENEMRRNRRREGKELDEEMVRTFETF